MRIPFLASLAAASAAASLPAQQFADPRGLALVPGQIVVSVFDVDGDGDADVVGAESSRAFLRRNDGANRFAPAEWLPPRGYPQVPIAAAADVDGDGDLDLVIAGAPFRAVLLRNDGAGYTDVTGPRMPTTVPDTTAVRPFDFDLDGDVDLWLADRFQDRLYVNDGTGTFTDVTAAAVPAQAAFAFAVAIGDVTGDGRPDVVTAGFVARVLRNTGVAFVDETATRLPVFLAQQAGVALGDVDGDGDLDLALAHGSLGAGSDLQDRLLRNDGTGTFTDVTAAALPVDADSGTGAAFGDFDRDGDLDLVIANSGPHRLLANDGSGRFGDVTPPGLGTGQTSQGQVTPVDLEGDGDADLVFTGTQLPRILRNDGAGALADVTSPLFPTVQRAIAVFDGDGDGDLDLVTQTSGASLDLLRNDGDGGFAALAGAFSGIPAATVAAAGDVDGDGDLDLATNRLMLNSGAGVFTDVTSAQWPGARQVRALRFGDVDGDADLDLVTSELQLAPLAPLQRLYRNDGFGTFTLDPIAFPAAEEIYANIELADVDGDFDLDLVAGTTPPAAMPTATVQPVRVYENRGGQFFQQVPVPVQSVIGQGGAALAGDLDRDGDLEIVYGSPQLRTLERVGGVWTDTTSARLPFGIVAQLAAIADVDLDGDLDLVARTSPGLVIRNDGTGVFAVIAPAADRAAAPFLFADLDRDGDVDALDPSGPLFNRHRGIALPLAPMRGRTLRIDVTLDPGYAVVNGTALLGASLSRAATPIPTPFGPLALANPLLLGAVPTIAAGTGSFSAPVPNVTALRGIALHFQGVALHGTGAIALTNAVSTLIE